MFKDFEGRNIFNDLEEWLMLVSHYRLEIDTDVNNLQLPSKCVASSRVPLPFPCHIFENHEIFS